ncbi:hypothetical protein EYF80_024834 [Liparis tanakae]|uniref:Uncharacterized protein n=1 Tax=Liparis tanakae TaxID=230148 RepID=A0A4Z2HHE1_9TELE|nr:hypothetical protein EYF80_024834 [Liparis tanakae]
MDSKRVSAAIGGIFLADEGLDVGVAILGVVELDRDAPTADKRAFSFPTCRRGAGSMVGLLWQVEDLLTGVRRGNGILTLSGCHGVVLFTVIIGIKELLKPLDEVKIILKSAFNQFLYGDNLNGGGKENYTI